MKKKYYQLSALLMVFFVQFTFAQSVTISGTVSDQAGVPLSGASVLVKGTSAGGIADFDGNFSIQVTDAEGKTLVVSYLGFLTSKTVLTGVDQTLYVQLAEDVNALDEVIVVGSSITQERKKLGNAITTVKAAVLTKQRL